MNVSAISPITNGSSAVSDATALVQAYGAVALIRGTQAPVPVYAAHAKPAVAPVVEILPSGRRRIDTYA